MSHVKAYYAGGFRAVIDGVPIRLARKPSAHNLAWCEKWQRYLAKPEPWGNSRDARRQKAETEARYARARILLYAEILEISEARAKALIAQHRQHILDNPVRDLSLEYDL